GMQQAAAPAPGSALARAQLLGVQVLADQAIGPLLLVDSLAGNGLRGDLVARARDAPPADELPVRLPPNLLVATVLKWSDRFDAARARLEAEHRRAVERGAEHELPGLLWGLAELECWAGRWALAARY